MVTAAAASAAPRAIRVICQPGMPMLAAGGGRGERRPEAAELKSAYGLRDPDFRSLTQPG